MQSRFDLLRTKENAIHVSGWVIGRKPENNVAITVCGVNGETVPFSLHTAKRADIVLAFFGDNASYNAGFFVDIPMEGDETFYLTFTETEEGNVIEEKTFPLNREGIEKTNRIKEKKAVIREKIHAVRHFAGRVIHIEDIRYQKWFLQNRATKEELKKERETEFSKPILFSILVPVYHTPPRVLDEMVESVLQETYPHFELCIVNADPTDKAMIERLKKWQEKDDRIRVAFLTENKGISGNTNEAMKLAKGEFIALLDHDDVLEPDALYCYRKALEENPNIDLLYSDEDKISYNSKKYFFPYFKSDWNPVLLSRNNFICHFLMVRKSLASEVGGWNKEYDGAQDHDFLFRITEKTDRIVHIPRILYHWRVSPASTASKGSNKEYALDAGRRAIEAHFKRIGVNVTVKNASIAGWYKPSVILKDKPLVSVLIPNKDHIEDLNQCITSLFEKCTYSNFEIIIIENNSENPETFAYYDRITKEHSNVRVLLWNGEFNYSAINNFGAESAEGEYLFLLNNDTEVLSPDLFENMLGYFQTGNVGIVGIKLLYPDRTIQHAGVLLGKSGLAVHEFVGEPADSVRYFCYPNTSRNVSAVTAAAMMVRRDVFREVSGLDESYKVAFNDIAFCLKVQKKGYSVVYDADSTMIHYESKSRGAEDTPEKYERQSHEVEKLSAEWESYSEGRFSVDPYYNPNLSYQDYFHINRG